MSERPHHNRSTVHHDISRLVRVIGIGIKLAFTDTLELSSLSSGLSLAFLAFPLIVLLVSTASVHSQACMLLDYRYMPLRFCFAHTHAATLKRTLHSILLAQRPVHVVVWYRPIIQAEAGVDGGMPR